MPGFVRRLELLLIESYSRLFFRPAAAGQVSDELIMEQLQHNPLQLGYHAGTWTVALLAKHLKLCCGLDITEHTLRRRMKQMGLRFKRPRYVYSEKRSQQGAKKGTIYRKLSQMPSSAVLLFEDETNLRLFPTMRRSWSMRGEQASIAVSGHNARRVLFGSINICTGHRIVMRHKNMKQEGFGKFLEHLRRCYRKTYRSTYCWTQVGFIQLPKARH